MRTRNANAPKEAVVKRTQPGRKSAAKTPPNSAGESATPNSSETKRASGSKLKQVKKKEASPTPNKSSDTKPQQSSEKVKASDDAVQASIDTEVVKVTRSAMKRTPGKNKTPTKLTSTPKSEENAEIRVEETQRNDDIVVEGVEEPQTMGESKKEEEVVDLVVQSEEKKQKIVELDVDLNVCAGHSEDKELNKMEVDLLVNGNGNESALKEQSTVKMERAATAEAAGSSKQDEHLIQELPEFAGNEESCDANKEEEETGNGEAKNVGHEKEYDICPVSVGVKDQLLKECTQPKKKSGSEEEMEDNRDRLDLGENGDKEIEEDLEEYPEETERLGEVCKEFTAIAKERKIKKEHEIFVGGLDRDATEEDLRKVFGKIGQIVEVRLHKNPSTNKNKGYAFVQFVKKEHAKLVLSEMKNPVIHGKRCGTAPSEDNDTLFLGNICNTWTKEAIKQKLRDYGIEGIQNITLVPDVQHEGLSRGFAFLEFFCHAEAMLAYKRLQKPDVIFGHPERTAKVAFAEPIREPDPEIMAQVKTVFVDGLPPHWDEDRVRECFKGYGEIVKIVLARNMSSAKRKDFGFVDFSTHEAAVACVDGVNNLELDDGPSKTKVRARLSNPLPKTQAVKGGMCGGFRIGHARTGGFTRFGRGFEQGRHPINRGYFHREWDLYHGEHDQTGRMVFPNDLGVDNSYPDFCRRQFFPQGGRRGPLRVGHYTSGRGAAVGGPSGPYFDRPWHEAPARGARQHAPPRRPYSPGVQFERSSVERHYDEPYIYDNNVPGMKRPFYMTDQDPEFMRPSRLRPRLEYADPALYHGNCYHDNYGAGSSLYSHDYYGSEYGGGPNSSFHGSHHHSYGRGYYY